MEDLSSTYFYLLKLTPAFAQIQFFVYVLETAPPGFLWVFIVNRRLEISRLVKEIMAPAATLSLQKAIDTHR
jgi:hypothetical protein